jgi:hypothetical protein
MDAAKRQTILINAAHSFTHYSLLILATAVLAMVQQDSGIFGGDYGPILALGTAMFVIYGICALPMGWRGVDHVDDGVCVNHLISD